MVVRQLPAPVVPDMKEKATMLRLRFKHYILLTAVLCVFLVWTGVSSFGQSAGGGASGGSVRPEATFVIRETPENLTRIEQIIERLDVAPKQVLIEAHIFDIALDDENATGIDWSTLITQVGRTAPIFQYDHSVSGGDAGNGTLRFGTLSNEHFQMVMKGLRKNNRARSLSNPKVTTINNRQATISVGQKIPYFDTDSTVSNGTVVTNRTVKFEDVPISLVVTPTIYDDDTIRLLVAPTITALVSFVEGTPWTEQRTSNNDIVVRNGETLIIGGLITERKTEDANTVPILEKIPLIKKFFANKQKTSKRSELVVFITPNIIKSAPMSGKLNDLVHMPIKED